ncbi:MAG: hypothetical protein V1897_07855 [Pseudomonadota bacterium]
MKTLVVFLFMTLFCFVIVGAVSAAETNVKVEKPIKSVTQYNPEYKCVMICKAPKPALEILEDGLAYALDVPLALLSPITSPITASLLEKYDSGPDRTYNGRRAR